MWQFLHVSQGGEDWAEESHCELQPVRSPITCGYHLTTAYLGSWRLVSTDPLPPSTVTPWPSNTSETVWMKSNQTYFLNCTSKTSLILSFQTAVHWKTCFSYQSIWTINLELTQWWILDSKIPGSPLSCRSSRHIVQIHPAFGNCSTFSPLPIFFPQVWQGPIWR
jgi:hypothetical protein